MISVEGRNNKESEKERTRKEKGEEKRGKKRGEKSEKGRGGKWIICMEFFF